MELKRLNGEMSKCAQSFEYNYGYFISVLRPFLCKYLQLCQKVKDQWLKIFKVYFIDGANKWILLSCE